MSRTDSSYTQWWPLKKGHHPAMTPACDRCGGHAESGVIDVATLRAYCHDCMTMVEKRCCDLGVSPFEPEDA